MRLSAIEAMKIQASKTFRFTSPEFSGFEDITTSELEQVIQLTDRIPEADVDPEQIDFWANVSLGYEGDPPESYRVLNHMIMDWVDDNEKSLKKMLNPELIPFLKDRYQEIDVSDLHEDFDDYIWEDQVDYYPEIDEDKKRINFVIELVLDVEPEEVDDA